MEYHAILVWTWRTDEPREATVAGGLELCQCFDLILYISFVNRESEMPNWAQKMKQL
jgi:hypothetical protein